MLSVHHIYADIKRLSACPEYHLECRSDQLADGSTYAPFETNVNLSANWVGSGSLSTVCAMLMYALLLRGCKAHTSMA